MHLRDGPSGRRPLHEWRPRRPAQLTARGGRIPRAGRTGGHVPTSAGDLSPFLSIDEVVSRFAAAGYITDRRLATTIYLVTRLNKPVLLEGPGGVGKTELGQTLGQANG